MRPEPPSRPLPPSTISGALRLDDLQTRRLARTGHWRPDGFRQSAEDDERILFGDRMDAISFVRRLVGRARERVIFVDPFFDKIDVREFAFATRNEGVLVSVLTGRDDNLWREISTANGDLIRAGDAFAADLAQLDTELQAVKRKLPDVRLMGERARLYHDRFLVIDDLVWHFGHSFNQVGEGEVSMSVRLNHPEAVIPFICEDIENGAPFLTTWSILSKRREREAKR
jgi:hypothetical protein